MKARVLQQGPPFELGTLVVWDAPTSSDKGLIAIWLGNMSSDGYFNYAFMKGAVKVTSGIWWRRVELTREGGCNGCDEKG